MLIHYSNALQKIALSLKLQQTGRESRKPYNRKKDEKKKKKGGKRKNKKVIREERVIAKRKKRTQTIMFLLSHLLK